MPSTTGYSFGDVVLVPFPFTDQSASKKRPAIIVSSNALHEESVDLIIIAVTTQSRPTSSLEVSVGDWKAAGLLQPSVIKPVLATVERDLILRRIGGLSNSDRSALRKVLSAILG